jgi:hypothetical protein
MVFNPTIGTYQNKKIREKRIKQVKTKSPMKILFLGLTSNVTSSVRSYQFVVRSV